MHAAEPVSAEDVRRRCRRGEFVGPTAGLAPGFEQANLVVLPSALADAFERFCTRNPRPCPLLDRTAPGDPAPRRVAPGADLRTDLPRYRVFRHGELVDEPTSIEDVWRGDLVAFLLGCSFSFENALLAADLPVRHIEEGKNVPMYRTRRACAAALPFEAPLVVSMRPMTPAQARRAAEITGRFPRAHGAPAALGEEGARELGIDDLTRPDFGDAVTFRLGEIPVFWACGVTSQLAVVAARPEFAITHAPGSMLVTDLRVEGVSA